MPEMRLDRAGGPRPLISLPRGADVPLFALLVEQARSPAGCVVCQTPIPKGWTRFKLTVRLPEPLVDRSGRRRLSESYYAHTGCLGERVGNEVPLSWDTCWDCGIPPPPGDRSFHPYVAFTTSKFAPVRLCRLCAHKPRWRRCDACHTHFPHWMISRVMGEPPRGVEPDEYGFTFTARDDLHWWVDGAAVCSYCATRFDVSTEQSSQQAREEYERLRDQIEKEGIFGGDA